VIMSSYINCYVRELLILTRTWFAFGLPSKTGCDIRSLGHQGVGRPLKTDLDNVESNRGGGRYAKSYS
jgi:hypothetical protein